MGKDWENRVFDRYVSVGKLTAQPDPEKLFGRNMVYTAKVIRQYFPTDKQAKILELGCGPAPFLYLLKRQGYSSLSGIDISEEQVALAHVIGLESEVQIGDMISFLEGSDGEIFDVVILFDILEHFCVEDQFKILDMVFACLKPEGKCIIHVPNAEGVFGTRILYSDITHKAAFTRRSMDQLLLTIGFNRIICLEDKPIPHTLFSILRRIIWEIWTFFQLFLLAVETGNFRRKDYIFSQNMLVVAQKGLRE